MPRYESGGAGNRFWEISVVDNQVITRSGQVGTDGRLAEPKVFDTADAAQKDADRRVRAKVKQGFALVDDDTSAQVRNSQLEAAILDNPDDDGPYLVYGDWLQSRGDPRGELVVVQEQRARNPGDAALKKREAKLLAELSPSRVSKMARKKHAAKKAESGYCELGWRLGFIERARVARNSDRPPYTVRELTASLLAHPAAAVLRSLTIGALGVDGQYDYGPVIEEIRRAAPRSLRELFIADFDPEEHADLSWSSLGDVSALYPVLPRLERLHLRAGAMDLGVVALPSLRSLTLTTDVFDDRILAAVAQAEWPRLEALALHAGGTALPMTAVSRLVGARMDGLRELALVGTDDTGELWRGVLRGSALLARLRVLDLSRGSLVDRDADTLLAARHQLEHLERLNVEANYLSEEAAAELLGVCPDVRVADQRPPQAFQLSDRQIAEFAPDGKSIVAARKIAKPEQWMELGRDQSLLWGHCAGSRGNAYDVYADVEAMDAGCTCPSQKYPCKHAIALLLLAQTQAVPEKPAPAGFVDDVDANSYEPIWE